MRIVHFSDIHIGALTRDFSALLDKRLLGVSNYYLRRQRQIRREYLERGISRIKLLGPDIVVCTGDFTCVGSVEEFALVRQIFDFVKRAPYEFIAIPGNHDLYVANRRCNSALYETFDFLNRGKFNIADSLPPVLERKNLRICLVNECRPTHLLSSAGYLPPDVRHRLQDWLSSERAPTEKRVLVGHFPMRDSSGQPLGWRRRLWGGSVIEQALVDARLDVSLCGHIHTPYRRNEPSGTMEICAGSLTVYGKINVLDYSPHSGKFTQFWEDISGMVPAEVELADGLLPAGAVD